MSMDVSGSKFIRVFDAEIRLKVSDKMVFANLLSSRRTGRMLVDEETGGPVVNANGEPVHERVNSRWEGVFVGEAFEAAKNLRDGTAINVLSGWITSEPYKGKDGKNHYSVRVTIADFEPSDIEEGVDDDETEDDD